MSRWVTAMMVDDFLHDPVLGAKVIFGLEIPPHMELRLLAMWRKTYMIDSSGYGTAKTMTIAIVAALRAILLENHTAGIISKTGAQGKVIFRYFDDWYETCPIFRNEIKGIVHSSDAWELSARNSSNIRMIPPNFLQDAERAASESWTSGYFDEWTRYGNYAALDKVLVGRVRKPVAPGYDADDPIYGQHWYFFGTAQRKSNPAYKKVQGFAEQIARGRHEYELQSWNFTHIPDKFSRLRGDKSRELLMSSLGPDDVRSEIMGEWVDENVGGWYTPQDVARTRTEECRVILEA